MKQGTKYNEEREREKVQEEEKSERWAVSVTRRRRANKKSHDQNK